MNTTNLHIPSNKVRDIERYILAELQGLYPEAELRQFTLMLFEAFLGWSTADFLLHRQGTINQSDLLRFHWAVEDLRAYRPIQHIIGHVQFLDCRIAVNPHVLIPRPETEEIVSRILAQYRPQIARGPILDLCTGSGCIAIALAAQLPGAQVLAADISPDALRTAAANAQANHVSVQFHQADLLNLPQLPPAIQEPQYALIISNPPYVRRSESATMSPNVLRYDPPQALWVDDDDPLIFYRSIARFASTHLLPGGLLVFEINEALATPTAQLIAGHGFQCQILPDFRDRPRCIIAHRS